MKESMYQQFDQYLHHELTQVELNEFGAQLKNDVEFASAFALYKETHQFLETSLNPKTLAFEENLKQIAKTHRPAPPKSKVIPLRTWLSMAASLVIVAGLWFVMRNEVPSYTDYNQHELASFVERSDNTILLKTAQKEFNNKNYKLAEDAFRKILASKKSPEIQFFFAICLIENNRYAEAEQELEILQKGNSIYKDKALLYMALSQLKQNKTEACKNYLLQIKEDQEDYTKAQELLRAL